MTLEQAAEIFGIQTLPPLHQGLSYEQAREAVLTIKKLFRVRRKELARIHHPDRGGDPEKMKQINMIMDEVEKIEITRRPMPQVRVYYYRAYSGTTTSWTGGYY